MGADGRSVDRFDFDSLDDYSETQAQTTARGSLATGPVRHNLLFGVDLSRSNARFRFQSFQPAGPIDVFDPAFGEPRGAPDPLSDTGNRLDELGLFIQNRVEFGEQVTLVLGGRYDTFEQDTIDFGADSRTEQTGDAFSPRFGLVYQPLERVSLYANYSKSYQPQIGRLPSGEAFRPTRGEQVEIGAKADLTERLSGSIAAFTITQANVTTPDPANPSFSVQEGEQRSRGVELTLAGEVMPGWNLAASYAYLDAETTRTNTPAFLGQRVFRTAPHSASFWSTYEIAGGPLQGLSFGGGVFYVGERPLDNANTLFLPSYTTVDAVVAYKIGRWRLALNAKNLTDSFAFDGFGANRVSYGAPRTVEGTVSWAF